METAKSPHFPPTVISHKQPGAAPAPGTRRGWDDEGSGGVASVTRAPVCGDDAATPDDAYSRRTDEGRRIAGRNVPPAPEICRTRGRNAQDATFPDVANGVYGGEENTTAKSATRGCP